MGQAVEGVLIRSSENPKYSIIVCVNNDTLFDQLVRSLRKTTLSRYEVIKIDNRDGKFNLPEGLNEGIRRAKGSLYVFCHQDIRFPEFWLDSLTIQIEAIGTKDTDWGVLGVMGIKKNGLFSGNIVDPHTNQRIGRLPAEVVSLDEVCLIIRKSSGLRFDEELGGFHFYGADICLQARQADFKCYSIDAPLEHLSAGKVDRSFWEAAKKLQNKWSKFKDSPFSIETTCGVFQLRHGIFASLCHYYKVLRRKLIGRLQRRRKKLPNG